MNGNTLKLSFILLALFISACLTFLTILMFKKKNEYRVVIATPSIIGIISIFAYIGFLLFSSPDKHAMAVLFDSLFFIGTDFLALSMMVFAIKYTDMVPKHSERLIMFFNFLCWFDSADLLVNNLTFHMFDLVYMYNSHGIGYWGNAFKPLHYMHLLMCYVMVGLTFAMLFVKTIKSAKLYKEKYLGVLISYIVVILANMFCYSMNTIYDVSVILYGILAAFICYYATFSFPHKLLNRSLMEINETISDGLLYFDINGRCVYANRIAKLIFCDDKGFNKRTAENYRNKVLNEYNNFNNQEKIYESFAIGRENHQYELEYQKEYFQNIEIGCYIKLIDKTSLLEAYVREKNMAVHDDLTGIFNRQGFFEAVDEYVRNYGIKDRFMACSDIKDFKLINEIFGEKTGDEVLIRQSQLLTKNAHSGSIYGRIGDDTFALFVDKKYLSQENLKYYMDIMKKITDSSMFQMYIHAGIYELTDPTETAQQMCDKALMAIESICNDYHKIFAYYDSSMMEQMVLEKEIANEFPEAMEKEHIKMYLQPIIDTENASFGAEALCRWEHPVKGILRPAYFLPVLEKSGLIFQLDEFIWESAASKLHEWSSKGFSDCYISVNISEKDFYYTDIYRTFTHLVAEYDINPSCLHIEITETVLMADFDKALILADKLMAFGFCVSIDNFGNGYSSLNMLKDFKADTLKIDMAFIKNNSESDRNKIILATIVEMAKNLDMKLIGEGVEFKNQYDLLRSFGCSIFQGNYLSEPLSVSDYEEKFIKFFTKK